MIYLLTDVYGNEIATDNEDVANEILESGANPFNDIEKIESYDGLVVSSYEDFCDAFY